MTIEPFDISITFPNINRNEMTSEEWEAFLVSNMDKIEEALESAGFIATVNHYNFSRR